jgi:ankyrin repeat protein
MYTYVYINSNLYIYVQSGFTALFYAVQYASIEIVQALLRRGADPNSAVLQEVQKKSYIHVFTSI